MGAMAFILFLTAQFWEQKMNGHNDPGKLFGRGISFPPRVGIDGRIAWSSGPQNIRESIKVILLTELGERLMIQQFGCGLQQYLFDPNTVSTRRLIEETVVHALVNWEPRVELESVTVEEDHENASAAVITIAYRLIPNRASEQLSLTVTFNG